MELRPILDAIRRRADLLDRSGAFVDEDLSDLTASGFARWAIPSSHGGDGLDPVTLHERYAMIASASLSTALVVTQRDAAIARLVRSGNESLRDIELPLLAQGRKLCTIGIAQLTTSRQFGSPALVASRVKGGWSLNGSSPWITSSDTADVLLVGAMSEAREPAIFWVDRATPGVRVDPLPPIVALSSSHTGSVRFEDAVVMDDCVVHPPGPLALGSHTSLPIGQAFLALGHSRGLIDAIGTDPTAEAARLVESASVVLDDLQRRVVEHCRARNPDAAAGVTLRADSIELVTRLSASAVAVHKGAALTHHHPVQRLARESMFLLVWACPGSLRSATLERLACS
jgi:alkylation response protein AidB-like acyl-CoA dehydrogenase